jgi:hypothetical protein
MKAQEKHKETRGKSQGYLKKIKEISGKTHLATEILFKKALSDVFLALNCESSRFLSSFVSRKIKCLRGEGKKSERLGRIGKIGKIFEREK